MNAFASLSRHSAAFAARAFAPGMDGASRRAWFPPDPQDEPASRDQYTVVVEDVTGGQVRRGAASENLQLLLRSTDSLSILIPDVLTYEPSRGKTTVLIGFTLADAERHRITEFRRAPGVMELDCERIAPLPPL